METSEIRDYLWAQFQREPIDEEIELEKKTFKPAEGIRLGLYRRIYNKALKEAIEKSGLTALQIQEKIKIPINYLSAILNFKRNPTEIERTKLSVILNTPEDILFPIRYDELYEKISPLSRETEVVFKFIALDSPEVLALPSPDSEKEIIRNAENSLLKTRIEKIIRSCSFKEQEVFNKRFLEEKTYEEIGKEMELSRERVRQIEAKYLERIKYHLGEPSLCKNDLP